MHQDGSQETLHTATGNMQLYFQAASAALDDNNGLLKRKQQQEECHILPTVTASYISQTFECLPYQLQQHHGIAILRVTGDVLAKAILNCFKPRAEQLQESPQCMQVL